MKSMKTLKQIFSNKILILFLLLHILLLNINFAEWGDSYRILRASEYIRDLSYPDDEKRQPLFSILLAVRPEGVDQVAWARGFMFVVSLASFVVFSKILDQFKFVNRQKDIALLLFTLNPVFLYWSIRVMADVPFTFLTLLAFYFYKKNHASILNIFLVGLITGLSVLIRFEGYILGFSLGVGYFLSSLFTKSDLKNKFISVLKKLIPFGVGSLIVMLPWLIYRNPFTSTYFEEPGGREYNLQTFLIYVVSLFYLLGFSSAPFFIKNTLNSLKSFLSSNVAISVFVVIELFLALIWPAAIPRLFTPVIPFLIILIAFGITQHFEKKESNKSDLVVLTLLLIFYIIGQYYLRLQFLVLNKPLLIFVGMVQVVIIYSLIKKRANLFFYSLGVSCLVWSLSTIILHKDIFRAVSLGARYAVENLEGRVAYNDVSSVSDWYLNQKSKEDKVEGVYLNMDSKKGRSYESLEKAGVDYVLITNEHNTDMEFDVSESAYLEQLKEFRYTIRGKEFFTKVIKFERL